MIGFSLFIILFPKFYESRLYPLIISKDCSINNFQIEVNGNLRTLIVSNFENFQQVPLNCLKENNQEVNIIEYRPKRMLVFNDLLSIKSSTLEKINLFNFMFFFKFINIKGFEMGTTPIFLNLSKFNNLGYQLFHSNLKTLGECKAENGGLFQGLKEIEFSHSVKYSPNICPFIFKNSMITELKFHGLSNSILRNNQLSFNANSNIKLMNSSIILLDLYFYKGQLDNKLLVFENVALLNLNGMLDTIETRAFKYSTQIRRIRLNIDNQVYFLSKSLDWMQYLNMNLRINFNNVTNLKNDLKKLILISFILSRDYDTNLNYNFPDKDFCLFVNFPTERLIFPHSGKIAYKNCSCLILWLFKNAFRIFKITQIPDLDNIKICEKFYELENETQYCNFPKRVSSCNLGKNRTKQINSIRSIFYMFEIFDIYITIFTILFGTIGLTTNILNFYILIELKQDKNNKNNITQTNLMLLNSLFNIIYLLTRFVHLMNKCITPNGIFCSSIHTTLFVQYSEVLISEFLGNLMKFFSNLSRLGISINIFMLLDIDFHNKINIFIQKKTVRIISIGIIILYTILLGFGIFYTNRINVELAMDDFLDYREYPDKNIVFFNYFSIATPHKERFYNSSHSMTVFIVFIISFMTNNILYLFLFCIAEILIMVKTKDFLKKKLIFAKKISNANIVKLSKTLKKMALVIIIQLIFLIFLKILDIIISGFIVYEKTTNYLSILNTCSRYNKVCTILQEFSDLFFIDPICILTLVYYHLNKNFKAYLMSFIMGKVIETTENPNRPF
ncbi:unnamed protein product [Brachionus calyciflorus]|uniref:Uncharacterized protein n=1 Tax=Brachionus calyciflorus TaxID=104777 RepID=A0A813WN93_9BILA|nr:unnamed protein product [Brachionus calyciflorus]